MTAVVVATIAAGLRLAASILNTRALTGPGRHSESPVPLRTSVPPGWTACVGIGGRHHWNTQAHAAKVETIVSDNGREYCGRSVGQASLNSSCNSRISNTAPRRSAGPSRTASSSGSATRSLEEHLRIRGRMTWYETLEEMQKDLDGYLETYNTRGHHCDRGMEGGRRTRSSRRGSRPSPLPGGGRSRPERR